MDRANLSFRKSKRGMALPPKSSFGISRGPTQERLLDLSQDFHSKHKPETIFFPSRFPYDSSKADLSPDS
jgi:hypothetical protein